MVVAIAAVVVVAVSNAGTVTSMTGTIKWYDSLKGYGFIKGNDNKDYFVHRSSAKGQFYSMEAGQDVEFGIKDSDKGPLAVDVELR